MLFLKIVFFFLLCFLVNSNRVTGIYELSLCKMADTGSPGKQLPGVSVLKYCALKY